MTWHNRTWTSSYIRFGFVFNIMHHINFSSNGNKLDTMLDINVELFPNNHLMYTYHAVVARGVRLCSYWGVARLRCACAHGCACVDELPRVETRVWGRRMGVASPS